MPAETAAGSPAIAGILFDKDGTLLDYAKSWVPVNYELARIAARGDAALADRLLSACGMDPATGHVVADSLLAAGNTVEIAQGMVEAGAPYPFEELRALFDDLFSRSAAYAVPVAELAPFFAGLKAGGYRLGVASSDNETSIRETARRFGFAECLDYVAAMTAAMAPSLVPAWFWLLRRHRPCAAPGGGGGRQQSRSAHGISAGAGLTVAVLTGTGSRQSLADADHCLNDITELPALLAARPARRGLTMHQRRARRAKGQAPGQEAARGKGHG